MPPNSSRNYNHGQKSLGQSERKFNSMRFTCDCRAHIFSDNLSQNSCIWRSDSWFGDGPSLSSSWLTILEFSSRTAFKNFSNTPLAKVGFYLNSNFSNCCRCQKGAVPLVFLTLTRIKSAFAASRIARRVCSRDSSGCLAWNCLYLAVLFIYSNFQI